MISLFDYQQRGFDAVQACFNSGQRRVLVCMPTGAGKTRIGAAIGEANVGSVLWVAHRLELVKQPLAAMRELGVDAGFVGMSTKIQVGTIQGLLASGHRPDVSMVITDEARHTAASEFSEIPKAYPNARILGLDATPERGDGSGLGAMFDALVTVASYKDLIAQGRLVDCDVIAPSKLLKPGCVAQHPIKAYQAHTPGQKAVLFAPSVQAAIAYTKDFNDAGIAACYVHGEMDKKVREASLSEFADGKYQVICNVNVLTDGWDSPAVSVVILARGCSTGGTFIQMTGRALRAFPGKKRATLLDLRGVSHVHGSPTEDRIYSLEGRAIRRKADLADARYCPVCSALRIDNDPICPECGVEKAAVLPPRVVNAKLEKRVYVPKATEQEKAKKLATLLIEGKSKGYKKNWPHVRYQILFGSWPAAPMVSAAWALTKRQDDVK